MNLQQAKNFCSQRHWFVTEGEHKHNWCNHCKKFHPFAVEIMGVGISRFWSEQEFIEYAEKLAPNSI